MRPLDDIDHNILALLRENARRTLADIGEHVSLSVAAVKRRIERLERDGVIKGYTTRVDMSGLDEAIEVIMEVYCADRTSPGDIRPSFEHVEEVVSGFTVSGEPDVLLRLRVDSVSHLEQVVERLRRDPNVVRTKTMLVLSTFIDNSS
ncbi:MAG TPA: Lrp/AsnC family transcriptional regulator [Candidatus Dormibacteraeota bacterium]|nr:Lrp/AsnC family transcriptional regulator [Candidatus Dormibacteraeota bacterium]